MSFVATGNMLACTAFRGAPAMLARPRKSPNLRAILRGQLPPIQRCYRVGRGGPYTFDPARLQPADYLDLSGICRKAILSPKPRPRPIMAYLIGYSPPMQAKTRMLVQFPLDTRGFLYYHPPTDAPPLNEGHLRFRITGSSDPASFSHGRDLLYPDGEPWNIAGGRLATTTMYVALRRMLLDDGLVTKAQLDAWGSDYHSYGTRREVLRDLETPFVIDFALETHTFNIPISPQSDETRRYVSTHPLTVRRVREKSLPVSLCTGRAICRFEDAGVHGKDGQSRVVLRLLKVLKPLEPSEEALKRGIFFDRPKEGGLFKRPFNNRTWTRLTNHSALHPLWERWDSERKDVGAGVERGVVEP